MHGIIISVPQESHQCSLITSTATHHRLGKQSAYSHHLLRSAPKGRQPERLGRGAVPAPLGVKGSRRCWEKERLSHPAPLGSAKTAQRSLNPSRVGRGVRNCAHLPPKQPWPHHSKANHSTAASQSSYANGDTSLTRCLFSFLAATHVASPLLLCL